MVIRARLLLAASLAIGLAMASPTAAGASSCKLLRIAEWPVRLESNWLIVDGAINGRKIGIVLDTGTGRSVIVRSAADRLGLTRQEARGYRSFGVGGETGVDMTVIDEFRIGGAVRKNWRVLVVGEHDYGRDIAVFLGYDFFEQVDVEFDLANKAVRLFQAKDCAGVSLAYWAPGGAGEVKLEAADDPDNPHIDLTVQINGQPARAMLDSGASTSVISRHLAASLGVTPETPGVTASGGVRGIGGRRPDSWIGPFQSFAIGDEIIRNPNIRFTNLDVSHTETGSRAPIVTELWQMLLGVDFLRAHRVLVAHSQRKIYFTYVGGPVFTPAPRRPPETTPPDPAAPAR
jgi:predicted aspartyl protease